MLLDFLPLLPAMLVLGFLAVRFWGTAIVAVLGWAMIEGAVRKWIFPGYQSQILLIKDVVLIFAYVGYFISHRRTGELGAKSGTLLALIYIEAIYCSIELLNPNSPMLFISVYGFKNYLIYLPLAFIVPDIVTDRRKLKRLLLQACVISIPIGLLGLYQFSQPPMSWVNQYVSHEQGVEAAVSLFGAGGEGEFRYGRARTSSTFSYIGGFTTFVLLAVPLAFSLLVSGAMERRRRLLLYGALLCSFGGALTTGSRAPIFIFAATLPVLLLVAGWKGLLPLQSAVRLALSIALVSVASVAIFGTAMSALQYRAENSDSALVRLFSPFTETAGAFETSPLIGTGLGSNSNASITILGGDMYWWLNGNVYELETARVMQELGFAGFVFVFLPKIFVMLLMLGYLRRAQSPLFIATHMAALSFVIPHFVLFTINNANGGLMYWSIVGVSIGAMRIERWERRTESERNDYLARGYPVGAVAFA